MNKRQRKKRDEKEMKEWNCDGYGVPVRGMEFLRLLTKTDDSFLAFKHLHYPNDVTLSIQAGWAYYCYPRIDTAKEDYSSMELAIMIDGEFVSASDVTDDAQVIASLEDHYDGAVHGFVPVETIELLHQALKRQSAR